jgi:hypothetical protein
MTFSMAAKPMTISMTIPHYFAPSTPNSKHLKEVTAKLKMISID